MILSSRGWILSAVSLSLAVVGVACDSSSGLPGDGSVVTCTVDSDCPIDQVCDQGICRPANPGCGDGGACPDGQHCEDGQCVPDDTDGGDGEDGADGSDGADGPGGPDIEIVSPPLSGDPPSTSSTSAM